MMSRNEWTRPQPAYMSDQEKAKYLRDLRDRPSRPSGSRPLPPSKFTPFARVEAEAKATPRFEGVQPTLSKRYSLPVMPTSRTSFSESTAKSSSRSPFVGRPLARAPTEPIATQSETSSEKRVVYRTPSVYVENGTRWMEKQETKSLRQALEDMDLKEDRKVYDAAQEEAAELVWRHQNPNAPYTNPDTQRDYRSHLRKGSYQRSIADAASILSGRRSASDGSQHSNTSDTSSTSQNMPQKPLDAPLRRVSPPTGVVSVQKRRSIPGLTSYDGLAEAVANDIANAQRRTSNGSKRILSGEKKQIFMHPNDRIWEDPQEHQIPPRKTQVVEELPKPSINKSPFVRKNPFSRVRMQQDKVERSNSMPILPPAPTRRDNVEIQKNPPSQSRNAGYTSNGFGSITPPDEKELELHEEDEEEEIPTKDGIEIRGDDIRAATSKLRRDYSPNLPRPTMVSDKPGRPIVSFEKNWKPREIVMEERHSSAPANQQKQQMHEGTDNLPRASSREEDVTRPPLPTINLPDTPVMPSIIVPDEPSHVSPSMRSAPATPAINVEPPSININGPDQPPRGNSSPQRPLPSTRPLPHHSASAPIPRLKSSPHVTPSIRQSGALCAECALPIAGRILSAAGQRFHPTCFICHQCHTNLEHVAFYPEPEQQRDERLARIQARRNGEEHHHHHYDNEEDAFLQETADGDESPRFYCHLDFHELFSPRCKSCKTPIEGEVVVACGAEWHVGHFFCAQCGDPFEPTTPFVEKDGYAWCVGCHTNRYSSKCRKCRKPVTDVVVKALGMDWHAGCFVCTECDGDFDDGRYFLRGESQDPVCVRCEERRLKA